MDDPSNNAPATSASQNASAFGSLEHLLLQAERREPVDEPFLRMLIGDVAAIVELKQSRNRSLRDVDESFLRRSGGFWDASEPIVSPDQIAPPSATDELPATQPTEPDKPGVSRQWMLIVPTLIAILALARSGRRFFLDETLEWLNAYLSCSFLIIAIKDDVYAITTKTRSESLYPLVPGQGAAAWRRCV